MNIPSKIKYCLLILVIGTLLIMPAAGVKVSLAICGGLLICGTAAYIMFTEL